MYSFIYDIPVKIYFGPDQLHHLGQELKKYGEKVLITYGGGSIKRSGLYDKIYNELTNANLKVFELSGIAPNPRVESAREGQKICRENGINVILAVGGGSTIDCSKLIAASACVEHDPWDFIDKQAPINNALPLVTVLTLAATGSEMDPGAVISNPDTNDKLAVHSPLLLPKASFLDPTLTYSVSAYQTACGSADILSHTMETYFQTTPNMYFIDCFMEGLMKTVIKYAPIAIKEPENYEARANLMWASSWAINGFAKGWVNGPWSCHPIEHEISAIYDITHGLGLAIITPRWLEYCLDDSNVSKYVQFGVNVFGIDESLDPFSIAKESIKRLSDFLFNDLGLTPTLSALGIGDENFKLMADKLAKNNPMPGFKALTSNDIENILRMCL